MHGAAFGFRGDHVLGIESMAKACMKTASVLMICLSEFIMTGSGEETMWRS